jgi:hypothetical protein
MTEQQRPAIEYVREGMAVIDVRGAEVGKVSLVRMGDAEAQITETAGKPDATTVGQQNLPVALVRDAVVPPEVYEPDLPEPQHKQYVRFGFVKADSRKLFGTEYYIRSDQIREVSNDHVLLNVSKDELLST